MKYFLQLSSDPCQWEEVDEYTYTNRTFARTSLDEDSKSRYSGNWVKSDGMTCEVSLAGTLFADKMVLSIVARLVNLQPYTGSRAGGICTEPPYVPMVKQRSRFIHQLNGEDYVIRKKAA
jgi:hypothetical protein